MPATNVVSTPTPAQRHVELGDSTAVEGLRPTRDARRSQRRRHRELLCGQSLAVATARVRPQAGDALLERRDSGVGDPAAVLPYFCSANRLAASSVSVNTETGVGGRIGVTRAPVAASGRWPAWMARVARPKVRSVWCHRYQSAGQPSHSRGDFKGGATTWRVWRALRGRSWRRSERRCMRSNSEPEELSVQLEWSAELLVGRTDARRELLRLQTGPAQQPLTWRATSAHSVAPGVRACGSAPRRGPSKPRTGAVFQRASAWRGPARRDRLMAATMRCHTVRSSVSSAARIAAVGQYSTGRSSKAAGAAPQTARAPLPREPGGVDVAGRCRAVHCACPEHQGQRPSPPRA